MRGRTGDRAPPLDDRRMDRLVVIDGGALGKRDAAPICRVPATTPNSGIASRRFDIPELAETKSQEGTMIKGWQFITRQRDRRALPS